MKFNKIYVLGAGAVGCYFGGMLARAQKDVTLIARPNRVNAINQHGLEMDCKSFQEVVSIKASSDLKSLADADLILLSVKSPDTEEIIQEIASIIPGHAVVVSLQNGVANADIAAKHLKNPIYAAVVYVAAGMIGDRTMKHHGRGELYIGSMQGVTSDDQQRLMAVCDVFASAGVPCSIAMFI